ncbi:MAG: ribonucleotide-diphosphate reductase subunit beta, partial [Pseudomonadota bacterium]|nr:ribonucleotide-diphosphate reductase subunit beta [Pseudomonadota bacterium]
AEAPARQHATQDRAEIDVNHGNIDLEVLCELELLLQRELYVAASTIVDHEDAFIDLAFEMGGVEGLEAADVKQYIRYIADRRLGQLGLNPIHHIDNNPLPWMDEMLNGVEHTNFFENRATEYSRAATRGSWGEAFE